MGKIVKRVLIGLLLVFFLIIAAVAYVGCEVMSYYSDDDVYGDIVFLKDGPIHVGDQVPMVLVVPEEYEDLHKEWWECYMRSGENLTSKYDYLLERRAIEEHFTEEEVSSLFESSPISLQSLDPQNSAYTTRMAIFAPEEPGVYVISIMGYYRTTSPQGYGGIEVEVYEK